MFHYLLIEKVQGFKSIRNFKEKTHRILTSDELNLFGGAYEIRTRDLLRDRQAF